MGCPGDLLVLEGNLDHALDQPEDLGADPDLHLHDVVVGAARVARVDRVRGRGGLGLLVGGGELLERELLLGGRGQLLVHRGEVLVGPGVEEAVGGILLGRAGRHHGADDERGQRHPQRAAARAAAGVAGAR